MSNSSSANTRQSNSEADKYAARKTDLKAAQTKLDTESDKLLKAERANVKEEEALNTHLQEVSTRTPVQKFVHRSKALVQGDIHGEWEGLDAIARTHNLEDAKKDALEQREKVVEAHKEVDKANRAMLNKEDHFLENEIKAEKVKLDSLADKKIRATGRNERIVDKKISRSKAKIKELEEKTVANETAAKQAKTAKNQETAKTNQKCTNDICTTTAIETKCQHSDKGRMAQIPPGGTMKELHVISCGANGKISEADIISIGQEGSCQKGLTVSSSLSSASQVDNRVEKDQHCPYLTVSGPSDRNFNICLPGPASNPLKFRALSPSHDMDLANISYMEFFENIFIPKDPEDPNADVSLYTIEAKCCDGPNGELTTRVHAHTQVEYKGKIAVGYAPKKEEKSTGDGKSKGTDTGGNISHKWDITADVSGKYAHHGFKLEAKSDDLFKTIRETLTGVSLFFQRVNKCQGDGVALIADGEDSIKTEKKKDKKSGDIVKLSINYPKMILGLNYANREDPTGYGLDNEWAVDLKLNPLIGATIEVDILQGLIDIAGNYLTAGTYSQAKAFLSFMRKAHVIVRKADKDEQKEDDKKNIYFKAEASIILKVEGTIDVEYQWKKLYGQQPKAEPIVSNCTGNTEPVAPPEDSPHNFKNSASVKLLLKGDAKMEGKCYAVKFAMAVGFQVGALKGTGPAAITTSLIPDMDGDDPVLGGRIDFTGLALYYMSIAEVQVKKKVNQKKVKSKGQMDGMDNDEEANTSTKVEANDGNSSISKDGAKVEEKNCAWVILEASSFPEDATETKTVLNLRNYDLF